jgi:hypothetical protein
MFNMTRTNIVLDENLVQECQKLTGIPTQRALIDFFKGLDTPQVGHLESLIGADEDICICGVILTEVLQGVREDKDYGAVSTRFDAFIYFPMSQKVIDTDDPPTSVPIFRRVPRRK